MIGKCGEKFSITYFAKESSAFRVSSSANQLSLHVSHIMLTT